jgi:glycosyltransferase involved in cell wall biosynthesis
MENNIPKFTFCITSKNNLRYLKHAVFYIKENSIRDHDVLVFIDADNDGTEQWCIENKVEYIKNSSKELFGIGNAYNLLVEKSKTDFVVIYHADMIMGKGFDIALYNKWKPKTVISATRIEPPLHPADPAKIVLDLGLWPEIDIIDGFWENMSSQNKNLIFNLVFNNYNNPRKLNNKSESDDDDDHDDDDDNDDNDDDSSIPSLLSDTSSLADDNEIIDEITEVDMLMREKELFKYKR